MKKAKNKKYYTTKPGFAKGHYLIAPTGQYLGFLINKDFTEILLKHLNRKIKR